MKRIFLPAVMMVFLAAGAHAQGISGGLKAGLNLANGIGKDAKDAELSMRVAYHFGGYLNVAFSDVLSFQPELLYNSVGPKMDEDLSLHLNYLSVPLNLMYNIGNFNIHAGPQFGFLMSAKAKADVEGQSAEVDMKEFFKSTDFGVNIGVGAAFGKLNASARYTIGMSKIWDTGEDVDAKNGVIQISLGYTLFGQ
ncbi:MAG TPA: porin family protein [Cyclobacteriaceae bacterium]|nr:porin family protein [Cyclobacteriaceae bacterium]